MRCQPIGPPNARIAIVGEAPGATEEERGIPFVGSSGFELSTMLADAKLLSGSKDSLISLMQNSFYLTNVCLDRPLANKIKNWVGVPMKLRDKSEVKYRNKVVKPWVPGEVERLKRELIALKPNLILALGNTPLWALADDPKVEGVGKWRGSVIPSDIGIKLLPAYHPAAVLRQYDWRQITVQDFRRAKREAEYPEIRDPSYRFTINPSQTEVMGGLRRLLALANGPNPLTLVTDVEIKRREILCTGIAWSRRDAICIPFYDANGHRWEPEAQVEIVLAIQQLFCHPNVRLCNQNISFDIQYFFWKHNFWPRAWFDTMIAQNVLFPGLPRRLDFLASMYNEHYRYWKDDGKFWQDTASVNYPQLWRYNCVDCVATFEVMEEQAKAIEAMRLTEQFAFQMHRLFPHVMQMMMDGVRVDRERKRKLKGEISDFITSLTAEAQYLVGYPLNLHSPKQLMDFFYSRLKLPVQRRKGIREGQDALVPTCDDDALKILAKREPLIAPLIQRINMVRSYGTALDACSAPLDPDGHWRTSYDIAGTETYRFSSSQNPFGSGLNLQNLTIGKDIL